MRFLGGERTCASLVGVWEEGQGNEVIGGGDSGRFFEVGAASEGEEDECEGERHGCDRVVLPGPFSVEGEGAVTRNGCEGGGRWRHGFVFFGFWRWGVETVALGSVESTQPTCCFF